MITGVKTHLGNQNGSASMWEWRAVPVGSRTLATRAPGAGALGTPFSGEQMETLKMITTNMISENLLLSHPIQNIKGPPNVLGLNSHFTNKEISPCRQRVIYLPSSSAEPGRKKAARTMRLMGVFAGRQELWPKFRAQRGLCTDLNSQEAHFLRGGREGTGEIQNQKEKERKQSSMLNGCLFSCAVCAY